MERIWAPREEMGSGETKGSSDVVFNKEDNDNEVVI